MKSINMGGFTGKHVRKCAAVVFAVAVLYSPVAFGADGSAVATRKDTMSEVRGIFAAVQKVYAAAPSYEAGFYLQAPRTPGEGEDGDLMFRLRERYRLLHRRGPTGGDSSYFRLEGLHGTNQGTVAVWSPAEKKMTVFRPNFRPMKLPRKDKRIADLFTMDVKLYADEFVRYSKEAGVGAGLGEEKCPKDGMSGGKGVCHVVVLTGPGWSMKGYVNAGTSLLEMVEVSVADGKGKMTLSKRVTWYSFKARDISDGELTGKPAKK